MDDLRLYIDFKSPYAFLAIQPICELEATCGVSFQWLPYTLDIPSYLGSATLDERGRVIEEDRNPHQWRRVRYSYMDARREANRQGLTLRGTTRIWDSSLAGIGLLYATGSHPVVLRAYVKLTFERFWRRELDIEDVHTLAGILAEAGMDEAMATAFPDFARGEGRQKHDQVIREAEAMGVFGVPTFVVDGELFWGREHLPHLRERLGGG